MLRFQLVLAGAVCVAAGIAHGSIIHVSPIGGGIDINSGPSPAFGIEPTINPGALAALHAQINATVPTDGMITFAALDTDHGLAMIALMDRVTPGPGAAVPGSVHMDGVSDGTSLGFTTDPILITPGGGSTRLAFGDFAWNSNGGGAAFGWAGLTNGSVLTWRFQKVGPLGLTEPATFQYVSWTGSDWAVVPVAAGQVSFSDAGEFAFAANVVTVPAPAGSAILAIAGMVSLRRRR